MVIFPFSYRIKVQTPYDGIKAIRFSYIIYRIIHYYSLISYPSSLCTLAQVVPSVWKGSFHCGWTPTRRFKDHLLGEGSDAPYCPGIKHLLLTLPPCCPSIKHLLRTLNIFCSLPVPTTRLNEILEIREVCLIHRSEKSKSCTAHAYTNTHSLESTLTWLYYSTISISITTISRDSCPGR